MKREIEYVDDIDKELPEFVDYLFVYQDKKDFIVSWIDSNKIKTSWYNKRFIQDDPFNSEFILILGDYKKASQTAKIVYYAEPMIFMTKILLEPKSVIKAQFKSARIFFLNLVIDTAYKPVRLVFEFLESTIINEPIKPQKHEWKKYRLRISETTQITLENEISFIGIRDGLAKEGQTIHNILISPSLTIYHVKALFLFSYWLAGSRAEKEKYLPIWGRIYEILTE